MPRDWLPNPVSGSLLPTVYAEKQLLYVCLLIRSFTLINFNIPRENGSIHRRRTAMRARQLMKNHYDLLQTIHFYRKSLIHAGF